MKKKKKVALTAKDLAAKGVPAVLIPGLLIAMVLGWKGGVFTGTQQYHSNQTIFPHKGTINTVHDGDTFRLKNGVEVRLLGIDTPNRGEEGFREATEALRVFLHDQTIYLEYDRYQDDKYGRVLAWVWVGCEGNPRFLPPDYMHETNNRSKPGLTENPENCLKGKLVNEVMAQQGYGKFVTYKDRGALKYETRILKK